MSDIPEHLYYTEEHEYVGAATLGDHEPGGAGETDRVDGGPSEAGILRRDRPDCAGDDPQRAPEQQVRTACRVPEQGEAVPFRPVDFVQRRGGGVPGHGHGVPAVPDVGYVSI